MLPILIDVALGAIVLETCALLARRRARRDVGPSLAPVDVLGQLLAGALLLLALRCSVRGADPVWTFGFFAASLPAHLFDLARRVRASESGTP